MKVSADGFHKYYDKIRNGIIDGVIKLDEYHWTAKLFEGSIRVLPCGEKIKVVKSLLI